MPTQYAAPGLPADWLNGWLAAIGITSILASTTLAWTNSATPTALFQTEKDQDLPTAIADALPQIEHLAIATHHSDATRDMTRRVDLETYRERAAIVRANRDGSLAASVSDLAPNDMADNLPHGRFDPSAPRGTTVYTRLAACYKEIDAFTDLPAAIDDTLNGRGHRVQTNGLGFDYRRLATGINAKNEVYVDPVIEILAFNALSLFPTRGDGFSKTPQQRGWISEPGEKQLRFAWPAWQPALDTWAIDALLDLAHNNVDNQRRARQYGIVACYEAVPYQPKDRSDVTRAFGSRRLW